MEEVIKYFEQLEARLAATEARIAACEERIARYEQGIAALSERVGQMDDHIIFLGEHLRNMMDLLGEAQAQGELVVEPAPVIKEPEIPVIEEPEPVVEEPVVVAEPEPVMEETAPATEPEPVAEVPVEEETVVEETASPKAAIYGKSVEDIRQAISLGDRFLYQRELFGQNAELMQKTLTELNALGSYDEALRYISRFGWDTESSTYQQFLVTLHRRFG